jgi:hypothetical protein
MLLVWACVLLTLTPAFSAPIASNTIAVLELTRLTTAATDAAARESTTAPALVPIPSPYSNDDAAIASALSNAIQATLATTATLARPAMQQTLQTGENAIFSNAPKLQSGIQSAVTDLSAHLPSGAAAAKALAGVAPALGPDAGDVLLTAAPALGEFASGALQGLAGVAAAAAPAVTPTLRTTATTKTAAAAAAAPAIAQAAERVTPTLGAAAASALTSAVFPAARQIPALVGATTSTLTDLLSSATFPVGQAEGDNLGATPLAHTAGDNNAGVNTAAAPDGAFEAGGGAIEESELPSVTAVEADKTVAAAPQAAESGMGGPDTAWPGAAFTAGTETLAPQAAPGGIGAPEMQPTQRSRSPPSTTAGAPKQAPGATERPSSEAPVSLASSDSPWWAGQRIMQPDDVAAEVAAGKIPAGAAVTSRELNDKTDTELFAIFETGTADIPSALPGEVGELAQPV